MAAPTATPVPLTASWPAIIPIDAVSVASTATVPEAVTVDPSPIVASVLSKITPAPSDPATDRSRLPARPITSPWIVAVSVAEIVTSPLETATVLASIVALTLLLMSSAPAPTPTAEPPAATAAPPSTARIAASSLAVTVTPDCAVMAELASIAAATWASTLLTATLTPAAA